MTAQMMRQMERKKLRSQSTTSFLVMCGAGIGDLIIYLTFFILFNLKIINVSEDH